MLSVFFGTLTLVSCGIMSCRSIGVDDVDESIIVQLAWQLKCLSPAGVQCEAVPGDINVLELGWIALSHVNMRFRDALLNAAWLWKDDVLTFPSWSAICAISRRCQGIAPVLSFDHYLRSSIHISSGMHSLSQLCSSGNDIMPRARDIRSSFLSGTGIVLPFGPDDDDLPLNGSNWVASFEGNTFPSLRRLSIPFLNRSRTFMPHFLAPALRVLHIDGIRAENGSSEGCVYVPSWSNCASVDGSLFLDALQRFPLLFDLRLADVDFTGLTTGDGSRRIHLYGLRKVYIQCIRSTPAELILRSLVAPDVAHLTVLTRISFNDPIPSWAWSGARLHLKRNAPLDVVVESSRDYTWASFCRTGQRPYVAPVYCGTNDEHGVAANRPNRPTLIITLDRITRLYCHAPTTLFEPSAMSSSLATTSFNSDLQRVSVSVTRFFLFGLFALSRSGTNEWLCNGEDWAYLRALQNLKELHVEDERALYCIRHVAAALEVLVLTCCSYWHGPSVLCRLNSVLAEDSDFPTPAKIVIRGKRRRKDMSSFNDVAEEYNVVDDRERVVIYEADDTAFVKAAQVGMFRRMLKLVVEIFCAIVHCQGFGDSVVC